LERTTPGMATKLTVTESMTVDWRVVVSLMLKVQVKLHYREKYICPSL
jgi:hypothetical protein